VTASRRNAPAADPPLTEAEIAAGAAFLAAILLADLERWPTAADLPQPEVPEFPPQQGMA
jgi:hypothetical protein